jgi:hypothetical protein
MKESRMTSLASRGACLVAALAATTFAQTKWVVDDDGGPGVHFTSLPAAVAAASTADILIVHPGTYTAFNVTGKALHIFGAGPGQSTIVGNYGASEFVSIANVPAGRTFNFAGFTLAITGAPTSVFEFLPATAQLVVAGASGVTVLQDLVTSTGFGAPLVGLHVDDATVHAARCTFLGGVVVYFFAGPYAAAGGAGADVSGAHFVAHDCGFVGGSTSISVTSGTSLNTARGGVGLRLNSASARLSRCVLTGGNANASWNGLNGSNAYAGDGVVVAGMARLDGDPGTVVTGGTATALVTRQGNGVVASPGSNVQIHGAPPITPGTGINSYPSSWGTPVPISGAAAVGLPVLPSVGIGGIPANAGGELWGTSPSTLTLTSPLPHAPAFLLLDIGSGFQSTYALPLLGEVLLSSTAGTVFGALTDASGGMQLTFTMTAIAPGATNAPLHVQFLVYDWIAGVYRASNEEIRIFRS